MQTAIYTLMASLLFGPSYRSIFLLPDAKKEIYYVVEQPTREKEIFDILQEFSQEQKAFDKGRKMRTKGVRLLFTDRDAKREELLPLFVDALEERKVLRREYIKDRLRVQDMLSPEEWEEIVRLSYDKFEKGRAGHDLEHARIQLRAYPPLQKIEKKIRQQVEDTARQERCLQAFEHYRDQLLLELDEIDHLMLEDIASLKRQNISEREMAEIADRLAEYRMEIFRVTLQFRLDILSNTTAEEWPALARAMVKLI